MTADIEQIKKEAAENAVKEMEARQAARERARVAAEMAERNKARLDNLEATQVQILDKLTAIEDCCAKKKAAQEQSDADTTTHTAHVGGIKIKATTKKLNFDWRTAAIVLLIIATLGSVGSMATGSHTTFGCAGATTAPAAAPQADEWVTVRKSWVVENDRQWQLVKQQAAAMAEPGDGGLLDVTQRGSAHRQALTQHATTASDGAAHARIVPTKE